MAVLRGFHDWPSGALHLAIGVFDGVHRGHQRLIARLREAADRSGATAVGATFDPLPIQALAPGAPPSALSDAAERADLLHRAGAAAVVLFPASPSFLGLPAREFVERVARAGDVRRVVVGGDFHFGHGREGDVKLLGELGREHGWEIEVMEPVTADGAVISSTRIRNLLVAGDVEGAAALLGRSYSVRGRIVHGDKRGRALGYPTINVSTPPERLLPRDGIYATWAVLGSERHPAATSLGVRPTFGAGERVLESFLLDLEADLYGEDVEMTFVRRLRDELRFETAQDLVEQIGRDVEATRQALRYTSA